MQSSRDYQIRDLGRVVITLRSDLVFAPQVIDGKTGYVIEDPINSKFYRIGIAEYKFISLLDGSTCITDALRLTAASLSDQAFTQDEAATMCKWLVDTGLAHTPESAQAGRLLDAALDADRTRLMQRLNPMFMRVPLVHPDRFLDRIMRWVGWLHAPFGWALAVLLGLVAFGHLVVHWGRFGEATNGVFAPNRWLWLGLSWLLLKVVHEISHGIVCRRYGGCVREAGVLFVLFAPLAYVDVTSSWRFPSKWYRIHTAAAGIYVELMIASVAAIVWSRTGPGVLNDTAFNVIVMAGLTTLVFNANPLMRFDGYYLLSDLLELPNLYSNGQQYVRYLGRRYLLGATATSPRWSNGKDGFIKLYGVATVFWRVVVSASLIIAAATMFAGAGVVLAGIAVLTWLGVPLLRFAKTCFVDPSLARRHRIRFVATTGVLITLIIPLFTVVPWPGFIQTPAIVEYSSLVVVRAGSHGFVKELVVHDGQFVKKGDVLAVLENHELRADLAALDVDVEETWLLCRSLQQTDRLAAYQAQLKQRESLIKQRQQKQDEVDQLIVRAPIRGQIVGSNLDTLLDTYVKQGAEILSVGNNQIKELQISVAQDDLEAFMRHIGKPIAVRVRGAGRISSVLDKVLPQASMEPLHVALCAPNGGPLAVREKADGSDSPRNGGETFELLAPRFLAVVSLDERQSASLHDGQRGVATFWDGSDTIGKHFYKTVSHWIRMKVAQATNSS